jgi:branched-chain amino acid transport system ATP-binding protein
MLQIHGLNAGYGNIRVLKDLSLEVFPGEVVTLIGANGAGKSTTLKTISGLIKATSGSILFERKPIGAYKPHQIVALGISQAPEGRGIFANLTVYENVILGAFLRRDKRQIQEDMERYFLLFPVLKERLKQAAGTLSGGEQQMLSITRALMARPKLLLLDEPSLGLAPQLIQQIFAVIEELNRQGCTLLLVEQNANKALRVAHRAYVLENGRMVMQGKASELLNHPDVQRAYLGKSVTA